LAAVEAEVVECRACLRLVEWRETAASGKPGRLLPSGVFARWLAPE